MKTKASWLPMAAVVLMLLPAAVSADPTVEIEKVPLDRDHLALQSGSELYQGFCAVCHGVTARGDGPATPALESVPSDLTRLAAGNDGNFPTMAVMHTISGRFQEAEYHTEMPAWEKVFLAATDDPSNSRLRVRNLTLYLRTIQQPVD